MNGTFTATVSLVFRSVALKMVAMPLRLMVSVMKKRSSRVCPGWSSYPDVGAAACSWYIGTPR